MLAKQLIFHTDVYSVLKLFGLTVFMLNETDNYETSLNKLKYFYRVNAGI